MTAVDYCLRDPNVTSRRLQLSRRARALAPMAVLCLLLQVVGMAHLLLVRHSVCATHGEVIEVGDPETGTGHPGVSGEDSGAATVGVGHQTVAAHDDHCGWM